jgi:succinoglycan biosynthesis transport protein ExoP
MLRAIYYMKRWAWLLILCPVLAGGVTLAVGRIEKATQPLRYEATIRLLYGLANPDGPPGYLSAQVASQLEATYSALLQNPTVLHDAALQLGLNETADQVASQIRVTPQPGNIIVLQADAATSNGAANLASAVVLAFNHFAAQLPATKARGPDIAPLGPATVRAVAASRISSSTAVIAALLGLAAAASLVALLYYLDNTIFQPDEIARIADVPVLSTPLRRSIFHHRAADRQAEIDVTVRLLLTALRTRISWPGVLFCAWASEHDCNPEAVLRLADIAARSGLRVVVINTDSQHHWLERLCGIHEDAGLVDMLLADHPDLTPYIVPLEVSGISVVPAGRFREEAAMLLDSPRLEQLIMSLRLHVDLTLITAAPVLTDPSVVRLAQVSDGVLFMATAQRSRRRDLRDALEVLGQVQASVVGLALIPPDVYGPLPANKWEAGSSVRTDTQKMRAWPQADDKGWAGEGKPAYYDVNNAGA